METEPRLILKNRIRIYSWSPEIPAPEKQRFLMRLCLLSTEKPAPMQIRKTVRNFRVSLWRSERSRLSPWLFLRKTELRSIFILWNAFRVMYVRWNAAAAKKWSVRKFHLPCRTAANIRQKRRMRNWWRLSDWQKSSLCRLRWSLRENSWNFCVQNQMIKKWSSASCFTPVCTRRSKMNLPYAKKKNRQRSIRSACGVLPRSAAQNFRKVWNRRHF